MNPWEPIQLPSWKPRPPSPGLEERLFGGAGLGHSPRRRGRELQPWVVPVTLGIGLVAIGLNPSDVLTRLDMLASNQTLALAATADPRVGAYLGAGEHSRLNKSGVSSFGWTNLRHSLSSIPLFAPLSTNQFRR